MKDVTENGRSVFIIKVVVQQDLRFLKTFNCSCVPWAIICPDRLVLVSSDLVEFVHLCVEVKCVIMYLILLFALCRIQLLFCVDFCFLGLVLLQNCTPSYTKSNSKVDLQTVSKSPLKIPLQMERERCRVGRKR